MKEQQERESIIEQLYYLRSGLSLICECKEVIERYNQDKKAIEKKRDDAISSRQETAKSHREQKATAVFAARRKRDDADISRSIAKKYGRSILINCLLLFVLLVGFYIIASALNWMFFDYEGIPLLNNKLIGKLISGVLENIQTSPIVVLLILVATVAAGVGLAMLIARIAKKIRRDSRLRSAHIKDMKKYESEEAAMQAEVARLTAIVQKDEEETPRIIEEAKTTCKKALQKLERERRKKAQEAQDLITRTYQALVEHTIIDSRDWGVLDLIIYAIETGRADSVKEALQTADQERRNDALVGAVASAHQEISKAILASSHQTQHVICQATKALAGTLSAMTSSVTSGMQRLASTVESGFEQVAEGQREIQLAQQTQIALQQRANWNSQQLLETMSSVINWNGELRVSVY